jgi:hypothetical protein
MPLILGSDRRADAEYLETCRKKRNIVEYDHVGGATDDEVDELISFVKELRSGVLGWLRENYPQLSSDIDNTS